MTILSNLLAIAIGFGVGIVALVVVVWRGIRGDYDRG